MLNSAPPHVFFCGRWHNYKKCRFWCFSKPDPDLVKVGHHLVLISGVVYMVGFKPFLHQCWRAPMFGSPWLMGRTAYIHPSVGGNEVETILVYNICILMLYAGDFGRLVHIEVSYLVLRVQIDHHVSRCRLTLCNQGYTTNRGLMCLDMLYTLIMGYITHQGPMCYSVYVIY
jgi:hypothetical protein